MSFQKRFVLKDYLIRVMLLNKCKSKDKSINGMVERMKVVKKLQPEDS